MGKKSHWKGGSSDAGLTEAVPSSSLGIYKAQLMKSLSNLIYLKLDLLWAGGWTTDSRGPFPPRSFYDLVSLYATKNTDFTVSEVFWQFQVVQQMHLSVAIGKH